MKKVPAIVDTENGDFALAESHAIMRCSSCLIAKVFESPVSMHGHVVPKE